MTRPQAQYLRILSERAGVAFDPALTKAEAADQIDVLKKQLGWDRPKQVAA